MASAGQAPEEITAAAAHFNVTEPEFLAQYTRRQLKGWACLRQSPGEARGCVFLESDGKCGAYEVRPVQCATYPFWPSFLESRSAWAEEARVPDDMPGRHWTEEDGGCEGIDHADAATVPAEVIRARRDAALRHWQRFPDRQTKLETWHL